MKYHLLILFFSENDSQAGAVSWTGKWYDQITSIFPTLKTIQRDQIDSATGIAATKVGDNIPAESLSLKNVDHVKDRISISFQAGPKLQFTSGMIRKRAWAILKKGGALGGSQFLPLCCLLTTQEHDDLFCAPQKSQNAANKNLSDELKSLETANDWLGIYAKFAPMETIPQARPEIWNDSDLLNKIGFAIGKLAETSGIPRDIFKDEAEKSKFLKQQANYRTETETLRKRCIELFPNNPSYHSTLGYLHYQNVHELTQPRGRRDGNIREEVEKAIVSFDKALSLDPSRISDLYRKGYLLSEVLPKQVLFGKVYSDTGDRPAMAKQVIQQGIGCFKKAESLWESLDPANEKQQLIQKRYRKDYIKTLYHTGCSFYELIINDWDEVLLALRMREEGSAAGGTILDPNQFDLQNADNAWHYFSKCWQTDLPEDAKGKVFSSKQNFSSAIEGVFKLYWLGKVSFARYWILSSSCLHETDEALKQRVTAEKYLTAALETPWSPENQRQKKDFVAELLARLYLTTKDYAKAADTISRHKSGKFTDPYVANTLAIALQLMGKHKEASQILADAINNHSNKAVWISSFLLACNYLNEEDLIKAHAEFETAAMLAKKHGKQALDSSLIGLAFVSYKSNDISNAVKLLEEANQLNPYRVAVQLRLEQWKQKLI